MNVVCLREVKKLEGKYFVWTASTKADKRLVRSWHTDDLIFCGGPNVM